MPTWSKHSRKLKRLKLLRWHRQMKVWCGQFKFDLMIALLMLVGQDD